jgi:putative ABC transport system permease protein
MKPGDLFQMGLTNLWRTKLRTFLTTLGVTIGIGALVSMVSFGTVMQKNITDTFLENDLFTSMQVLPKKIDMNEVMSGNIQRAVNSMEEEGPALNDSALDAIRSLDRVEIVYPEIRFPVTVRLGEEECSTTIQALPAAMGRYKPFNELPYGSFFETDTAAGVIITPYVLEKLKIKIKDSSKTPSVAFRDTLRQVRTVSADSILGLRIGVVTSVIDISALMRNPLGRLQRNAAPPVKEATSYLRIAGIQKKSPGFEAGRFGSGLIVPMKTAENIPRLGFSSVWDLMNRAGHSGGYGSVYVRVRKITDMDSVKSKIESMGFGSFSISDQLEEIKKGFIVLDIALGTVGAIALVVAALGIINTMVMSILERTREIGIMKAIGGSENEIKGIFFIEAGSIGLLGGIFGLGLGWAVSRIANVIANYFIAREGGIYVDLFYIPAWLILGAILFSILVSLLAGLYPAMRAARVDPVEALRHD